ncbi:MAG: hypothetical protein J7452_09760 [Thermoflexus sp.]|nr:hypothetical protein [Thermoflexus sp.]
MTVTPEGNLFRAIEAVCHLGPVQPQGVVRAKLCNLRAGVVVGRRFRPEERVEEVTLGWSTLPSRCGSGRAMSINLPSRRTARRRWSPR